MARSRRRRVLLVILVCVATAAAILRLPVWSSQLLAHRLSATFHRPARVGEVHYRLFPPQIEALDIRVAGARPTDPPLVEIPRLVAVPRLRPLWDRRAVLARLELQGARLRLKLGPGDELPAIDAGRGSEVRIDHLVISHGEILFNDTRLPLDLDLPGFEGALSGDRAGTLRGRVAFGPGTMRFADNPVLAVSSEAELAMTGTRLVITNGHARAPRTDLDYHGQIDLAPRLRGQLAVAGPVDLQIIDRHLAATGLGLRGAARYDGAVELEGSEVRLSGRIDGTDGRFEGIEVPRYAGRVSWDGGGLRLRDLDLSALGGTSRLDVDVPPRGQTARVEGTFEGVDAEGLAAFLFETGSAGLGASASGQVALSWPRGSVRSLSGTLALDLADRADGRTPLSGRLEWSAREGVQTVESADFRTPSTQARLRGRIARDQAVDLELNGESRDLADTDGLIARLRRALGTRAEPSGFAGAGTFRGRWRGTLGDPVFEGRFTGQDVGYLGVVWGRAEWAGTATSREVESHSLVLRRPGAEIWLDGRSETGESGTAADGIDLRARLTNWPVQDLVRAMESKLALEGPVSGELSVSGRRSDPRGSLRVSMSQGRYYGWPFRDLALSAALEGPVTRVTSGQARTGGGQIRFTGSVTDDGVYDGTVEAEDVELTDLATEGTLEQRWGGKVSGRAVLQGPLDRPHLEGRLTSRHLFFGDEGVGALEATVTGAGDGRLTVSGRCQSSRVDLELSGTVGATAPYAADVRLLARSTSLDPFLRAALPSLPTSVAVVASGEVQLSGPLQDVRQMDADAEVTRLELLLPDYPVRNPGPLRVALHQGRLELKDARLSGEGTDLGVEGSAALAADGPLDLQVRGSADLRALSLVMRDLRSQGGSHVAVHVGGTRTMPRVDGTLDVEAGVVRVRGFPHGLENVRGQVRFTEGAAHLVGLTGLLAGGPLELAGQATYGPGRPLSFDLQGTARGMTLRYPEGLRTAADADLRLYGDLTRQWLTGRVDVRQALYDRRYDVASELLAETRRQAGPPTSLRDEGLHYDLKLAVPGTLKIDNNLASLQARADLTLQGTYDAPVILGHAEVERGRVYYQGNTYLIRRGSLDFTNPHRTNPLFDIEAETRIRDYRLTLKVNGTVDRFYPTFTADPPLSTPQIVALLAGVEDPASMTRLDSQQLAYLGAGTLAAGRLSEEVGLERQAARIGLTRFSIDPALVRNTANPTARLTVGRRLTPDLNVVFSLDLRGSEEPVVSAEYTLSDRLSLLLTRDESGGMGFDLRLRKTR